MKNKYCPDVFQHEAIDDDCEICDALNRQREDMEKGFLQLAKDARLAMTSKSEYDEWNSALHQMATKIERYVQSLNGGDKILKVDKEV